MLHVVFRTPDGRIFKRIVFEQGGRPVWVSVWYKCAFWAQQAFHPIFFPIQNKNQSSQQEPLPVKSKLHCIFGEMPAAVLRHAFLYTINQKCTDFTFWFKLQVHEFEISDVHEQWNKYQRPKLNYAVAHLNHWHYLGKSSFVSNGLFMQHSHLLVICACYLICRDYFCIFVHVNWNVFLVAFYWDTDLKVEPDVLWLSSISLLTPFTSK